MSRSLSGTPITLHSDGPKSVRSAADLYRELLNRGYQGSSSRVRHFVAQWRRDLPSELKRARRGPAGVKPATADRRKLVVPSPLNTAWRLLQKEEKLELSQPQYVRQLCAISPEIAARQKLAQRFGRLIRERDAEEFVRWLAEASESVSGEMQGFAAGLRRDQAAVEAALRYEWSNGQTEGQVNRLKNLKRQMSGRAGCDLLKARGQAAP